MDGAAALVRECREPTRSDQSLRHTYLLPHVQSLRPDRNSSSDYSFPTPGAPVFRLAAGVARLLRRLVSFDTVPLD